MIHDTKETSELITAGAVLYKEIAGLKEPSAFRLAIAVADEVPVLVAGLHGAHQVPAELADLTEEEAQELEALLGEKFHSQDNLAVQVAVRASARAVLAGVLAVRAWRDALNPAPAPAPAPDPAEEPVTQEAAE